MSVRIAHYVSHGCFLPAFVDFRVALLASLRADVGSVSCGCFLWGRLVLSKRAQAANEKNQFPAFAGRFRARITPWRHARELDSIFDDVVEFAVTEILCGRSP